MFCKGKTKPKDNATLETKQATWRGHGRSTDTASSTSTGRQHLNVLHGQKHWLVSSVVDTDTENWRLDDQPIPVILILIMFSWNAISCQTTP